MGVTITNDADTITYESLRYILGLLAVTFPFVLIIGNIWYLGEFELEGSMSAYYYTRLGDVFVGIMISMGVFLWAYVGYDSDEDNLIGNVAGTAAIVVALLPTTPIGAEMVLQNYIHLISAVIFFIMLAYYCLVLFRRTNQPLSSPDLNKKGIFRIWEEIRREIIFEDVDANAQKTKRNRLYKVCGWIIVFSLILLFILVAVDNRVTDLDNLYYTLWLELIPTVSFGVAWLVKSEKTWLFRD